MRAVGISLSVAIAAYAAACASAAAPPLTTHPSPLTSPVRFDRDIRPILSENCFKCHGPDPGNRQGGLRLDRREDLYAKRAPGAPVVPGRLDASRIWARISDPDPARRMPPPSSGKTLSARQKDQVRQWIAGGAKWSQHWAFVPPQLPTLPTVQRAEWCRNPIDRFVLARLEKEGLRPSPEADPVTLIRRVTFDLTGLPPTPEEVDAFLREYNQERSPAEHTEERGKGKNSREKVGRGSSVRSASSSLVPSAPSAKSADRPHSLSAPFRVFRGQSAYERLVDRLLASPHYGEKWGRQWLDAARYADSDGFEKDKLRWVWFYRDWVINALNRDLPYDRFVIEQIAGDLLPNATQGQVVATGFLRNSMINEEGGVDPEQFRMEAMFDRMDALGKSVLGLTIQCAQCHSHKYDPLTQEDYYRMFAFLNNSDEGSVAVYTPEQQAKREETYRRTRELEAKLQHEHPEWQNRMDAWERTASRDQPAWRVMPPKVEDFSGEKHRVLDDHSVLAQSYAPTKHTTDVLLSPGAGTVTAVRLELLNDPNLPRTGPGRSFLGTGALTEFRVDLQAPGAARQAVKLASATADVNPEERELLPNFSDKTNRRRVTGPVGYAIDGKEETAWGIDVGPGRSNVPRKAVFVFEKPVTVPEGGQLVVHLAMNHGGWNSDDNQSNNLGRYRLSVTDAPAPVADPMPAFAREALSIPPSRRTPAQAAAVFSYWRTTVPEWQEANAAIEQLWKEHPEPVSQLVLHERENARGTHRLDRGDFLKPAEAVQPGVPAFLHPMAESAGNEEPPRLRFARWLVDRRSPTTGRSIVNRIWQGYFGTGLVRTSEDLGTQAEPPSHPELLDYLAVVFSSPGNDGEKERLRDRGTDRLRPSPSGASDREKERGRDRGTETPAGFGWSMKKLHRLIVLSNTYRQSSALSPSASSASSAVSSRPSPQSADPENRLLSRGPRLRLEAEGVRDVALAAAGLLSPKVGGPSVFPPAPEFLFLPPTSYGPKVWPTSTGEDRYRRAVYTFRYRSVPYPVLQAFDAPNGDQSCVRRVRSNTPLQALTTLNEPLFLECARALARKTLKDGGSSDAERIAYAFRRCTARKPAPAETGELLALLDRQTERYSSGKTDPWALAAADEKDRPELPAGISPARLAGWTAVARVLLNLDETITKE